jgi:hypothetical protein
MNTLTAYCEGNIHTVVDEKRDIVCFAFFVELFCCRDEDASV